jgi:hypothetical protein
MLFKEIGKRRLTRYIMRRTSDDFLKKEVGSRRLIGGHFCLNNKCFRVLQKDCLFAF